MNVDTVLSQLASWPEWLPFAKLGLYFFSGVMVLFVGSCMAALVWTDQRHRNRNGNTATTLH